jgi:hypothetical protein
MDQGEGGELGSKSLDPIIRPNRPENLSDIKTVSLGS